MQAVDIALSGLLVLFCAAQAEALAEVQAEAKVPEGVQDLTDQNLTPELLQEVLQPRTPPPSKLRSGSRGLGTALSCERYNGPQGRGIGALPISEAAAIEVLFAFDSSQLLPSARHSLDALGEALLSQALASCCFRIEGHADSIGETDYNQQLSERRAHRVVDYLVAAFSIDRERLQVVGHGESQPIADNSTESGRRKNRRVQVVNLGYAELGR